MCYFGLSAFWLLAAGGYPGAISGCAGLVHEDAQDLARPVDIPWQQADITCASEDLGWRPRRDLGTSLTDLWEASL